MNRFPSIRVFAFLTIVVVSFAAFADPIARNTGGGATMDWQVNATGYERVQLRWVAPDGEVGFAEFPNGKRVSLSLNDLGTELQEGHYQWELWVVPKVPQDVAAKFAAARAANDDKAARKIMKDAGLNADRSASGGFLVVNGQFVNTEGREEGTSARRTVTTNAARPSAPIAVNDQVIPDDLIVQGSLCVGFDCVNGEDFGFDTIRLKENNTRVQFDDTSSTAGFPTNNWQIRANDSASGGSSFLGIVDQGATGNSETGTRVFAVSAGAPANSIFVSSTGRVGFRTATPVLDLHVNTTDTPAIRLEQNSSGGWTAQTWDVAGNEANFFIRDVTSGSRLPLRIRPGAPTSSVDIAADGDVGIGTASPETDLHVFGSSTSDVFVALGEDPDGSTGTQSSFNLGYGGASFARGVGFINVRPDSNASAPNPSLRFMTANTVRILIDNEGFIGLGDTASAGTNPTSPIQYTNGAVTARLTTAGVWQDNSSRAAKENIHDLSATDAFKALQELNPVTYNYKVLPTDGKVGFIAEDVPEIVASPERDGLSALDIVAVVTKVVQEHHKVVQEHHKVVQEQQKTIDALTARIAELEKERQQ